MVTETMSMPVVTFENLAWVHDNPTTLACRPKTTSADTVFRGRRSHRKSRLGCGNCKRRRVKCDETKPKCEKCIQQRIACDYLKPPTPPDAGSKSAPDSPWSSATTSSMSSDLVEAQLRSVVRLEKGNRLGPASSARNVGGSLIEILQHFECVAWSTIGTTKIQQTMRANALSLAQDSPFLLNAIFAFSARHLHTLKPDDPKNRTIALYHSQVVLQLYSQELNGELTLSKVDALIAACLLVSAIVFFTEDSSPSASFVFSDDPKAANWLLIVAGLSLLLNRPDAKDIVSQSLWMPIFTGNRRGAFSELASGKAGIPEPFAELCRLDEDSTADNNPYHGEIRLLTHMMAVEANKETFAELVKFPCRMKPAFNVLLREKDPVALLILAYWFAKILEVDFWWLGTRVRSELFAICSYLDGWPDERFQPLLQYPMKACGYVPINLDLIETYVFGI